MSDNKAPCAYLRISIFAFAVFFPATLPAVAIDPWKRGFIFGWCMIWHFQPFLDEEAEMKKLKPMAKRSRKQKRAKRGPRARKPRD